MTRRAPRRLPGITAAAIVAVAAGAGMTLATQSGGGEPRPVAGLSTARPSPTAKLPVAITTAVRRLGSERRLARRRVARARTAQGQAAAAARVARAFAREAGRVERVEGVIPVTLAMRSAGRMYEDLAQAAHAGHRHRFSGLRERVADRERRVERALRLAAADAR